MRIINRPSVIALGVATLCLLPYIRPLLLRPHLGIYHLNGSALVIYIPMLLNVCALWLLLTGMLWFAQKPRWPQIVIWLALILFLPWLLLASFSSVKGVPLPHLLSQAVFSVSLVAFIVLLLFWRPSFDKTFENIRGFVATLLAFGAFSGALIFAQLLWLTWQTRTLNTLRPLHHRLVVSASQTPSPRVVWIILDELSYQQVYDRRFPGLQLPTFDQFASRATVFTHVIPAGNRTETVVPSLMTGIHADDVRSSPDGQLSLHNSTSNVWQHFDPHETVFQSALNDGYSTAIAGWYNPYCRIMPQVLDHCFWTFYVTDGAFAERSFTANLLYPLRDFISVARSFVLLQNPPTINTVLDAQLHIANYHVIVNAADVLLSDPTVGFMLLHIPAPHPGGIYNRRTSTFTTTNSSYIDNLALADHYLAHVRQVLQQQGTWDSSVIVVMGDHSWRTKLLWQSSPSWTAEDQAASNGGQFDDRPAYIVKLPNQQQASRIDTPFAAIRTRALLDAILNHHIRSADDLATWAKLQDPMQGTSTN